MEKEKIKQLIENNIAGQDGMNPYNQALVDVLNDLVEGSFGNKCVRKFTTEREIDHLTSDFIDQLEEGDEVFSSQTGLYFVTFKGFNGERELTTLQCIENIIRYAKVNGTWILDEMG